MGFDCDVPEKVLEAMVGNHWGGARGAIHSIDRLRRSDAQPALPEPNMIVQRRSNSHSHVSWFLSKPVHRGPTAREAPLRLFARISEFYRHALGADPGYNGVLTHNPMPSAHPHGEFVTHWDAIVRILSASWQAHPKGLALAGQADHGGGPELRSVRRADEVGRSPANIGREVLAVARATNDGLDVPLGDGEVAGIAKSVERYRRSWIAQGRFYTEAEREAWGRVLGLRSGLVRRKGTAGRDQLMFGGGSMGKRLTQAQIAALHGVSQPTVSYVMHRAGHSNAARIAARNKSIREDPRTNAELASEHGLTVRQIRAHSDPKLGGTFY